MLLKLANTVLILINMDPSNVKVGVEGFAYKGGLGFVVYLVCRLKT